MPNNLAVSQCPSQDPVVQQMWETLYGASSGRSSIPITKSQPIEDTELPVERFTWATPAWPKFEQVAFSGGSGAGDGSRNHLMAYGFNIGAVYQDPTVPYVAGQPSLIMGFEDNYFATWKGAEWYIESFDATNSGFAVNKYVRPFYCRINLTPGANMASVVIDIGSDGTGAFGVQAGFSANGPNLLVVQSTLVQTTVSFQVSAGGQSIIGASTGLGLFLNGTITASGGAAWGVIARPILKAAADNNILAAFAANLVHFDGGARVGLSAYGLYMDASSWIKDAGTIAQAAGIIVNAPSIATTNYALWVTGGLSLFQGGVQMTAGAINFTSTQGGLAFNTGGRVNVNATGLSFFAAAPVAQQATTGTTAGFTANAGTAMNSASTSTGGSGASAYTFGDVVLALKNYGLLAA